MRRGALIRSGKLSNLPPSTVCALRELGVSKVIDLRSDMEQSDHPGTRLEFAEEVGIPLLCSANADCVQAASMARLMFAESRIFKRKYCNTDEYMLDMYRKILFRAESQAELARFLREIAYAEGCVLFHCTAGKDRTGVCAMLLEGLLGVREEAIVADYVASAAFQRKLRFWQKIALWLVPVPRRLRSVLLVMMKSEPLYIRYMLQKLKEMYGGVTEYCRTALGITQEEIALLRKKYLV